MEVFELVAFILFLIVLVSIFVYRMTHEVDRLFSEPRFSIIDLIWPTQTVQRVKKRLFTLKCPFCRGAITDRDTSIACPTCTTRYHNECSIESGKCSVFGCRGSFLMKQ